MNVPPSELPKSLSSVGRARNRFLMLESLFRVIIACYCGHIIGRVYASGYDHLFRNAGTPEVIQTLRVSLKILTPTALALGYFTSMKLAQFVEYRWRILISTWVLYMGILTQRGYFGTEMEIFVGGLGLASFGSGMTLLPSHAYQRRE